MNAWIEANAAAVLALAVLLCVAAAMLCAALMARRSERRQARALGRLRQDAQRQSEAVLGLHENLNSALRQIESMSGAMETRQDRMRRTLDERMELMNQANERRLEQMQELVSGKLDGRLSESFQAVNGQLERVHRGLGEMRELALGVTDLRKMLGGVKTRGVWGEVRLRALLEQTLAPGQYIENAQVEPGAQERVEFALILPAAGGEGPLLPIDSKFPQEDYLRLVTASEAGDAAAVERSAQQLERAVLEQAKRISEKYIRPPRTADFAILFLPVESLYAEVIRRPGLSERIQTRYRVMLAGPATLNALLTSLQMGFRTVALEQRSGEVLALLTAVREEFARFGEAVQKARQRLEQAEGDLDSLDTRARAINRRLKDIGE